MFKKLFMKKPRTLQERYPQYLIGRESYGIPNILSWEKEEAKLQIGAFCSFASEVKILLEGNHRLEWVSTLPLSVFWDIKNEASDELLIKTSRKQYFLYKKILVNPLNNPF